MRALFCLIQSLATTGMDSALPTVEEIEAELSEATTPKPPALLPAKQRKTAKASKPTAKKKAAKKKQSKKRDR
jgi:hypothetical protein